MNTTEGQMDLYDLVRSRVPELEGDLRAVLLAIAAYSGLDKTGACRYHSLADIANVAGVSGKRVTRLIRKLERRDYITVERRLFWEHTYRLAPYLVAEGEGT